jgi:ribosomal protein L3 glutamine methyltransferase
MENTQSLPERPRTVGDALQYCVAMLEDSDVYFGHGTDNPWDEAVQLVLFVVDLPLDSDEGVTPHPLNDRDLERLQDLLKRRVITKVPLPYLLGRAWFAGLEFHCDDRAIIPRSPIAELVENNFQPWYHGPTPTRLLDLCCGGGCIGLAAAHYYSELKVDLAELDSNALALAQENCAQLGLTDRVSLYRSDLFTALKGQKYDIILSNPPYVSEGDLSSMPAEYHHEPELALGSGADGLALTRKILSQAGEFLTDQGLLIVEVGNSWVELEAFYPRVPFTWLEFEHGGHGVFAITAKELRDYSASFTG